MSVTREWFTFGLAALLLATIYSFMPEMFSGFGNFFVAYAKDARGVIGL